MKNIFKFDLTNIKGDFFGGITSGIVALPLALAFGLQSGMGAQAGLYGAIFIAFFAAWLGGTRTQISGPTAPMTAVSMVVISGLIQDLGTLETALPAILTVFLLSGIFQIVLGVLGIGQYIKYIPYPVISGFMTGIGVIILFTQILPMLGYYPENDRETIKENYAHAEEKILENILQEEEEEGILVLEDFETTIERAGKITTEDINQKALEMAKGNAKGVIGALKKTPRALERIGDNWMELVLGLATIFIIYGFKRITTTIPSTLVALLVVSLVAYFVIKPENYRAIGEIPSGFPVLRLDIFTNFNLGSILPYVSSAFSLAALGIIDSLLTSVVADNMTNSKHNSKQELIGQGLGNSIAALFGGIPGAGATIRTVVNIQSGGKTRISGMIAGILLLIVLLSLGPAASQIPAAVLAGILVTVGIGVMDYKGLRHIKMIPITDAVIMIVVLLLTVFVGLLEAVAIGMVLASLSFMKTVSDVVDDRTKIAPLREFSREVGWDDEGNIIDQVGERLYIKHLDGPLFFGFASRFKEMIKALPELDIVVIRMDKVPYVDQSGLYAMEDAIQDLQEENITVVFTDIHGQPLDMFERINIIPSLIPREHCFKDFATCMQWLEVHMATDEGTLKNIGFSSD